MTTDLPALQARFNTPGRASIDAGQGGLPCINITTAAAHATIYLHGGHVTHYQPHGQQPLLFMTDTSWFEPEKPIRGGVPVCFPWFGPGHDGRQTPAHGFARLKPWSIESITHPDDDTTRLTLLLASDEKTRALWPHDFELRLSVTVGSALTLALQTTNTSHSPLAFEEALHTYFLVGDIHRVTVAGLEDAPYLDKAPNAPQPVVQPTGTPITFTGETDRVYSSTAATIIHDPAMGRRIEVGKAGSASTVVWNPWIDKAKAMADFNDNDWPAMVCVETANVRDHGVTLPPGAESTMSVTLRIVPV